MSPGLAGQRQTKPAALSQAAGLASSLPRSSICTHQPLQAGQRAQLHAQIPTIVFKHLKRARKKLKLILFKVNNLKINVAYRSCRLDQDATLLALAIWHH